MYPLRNPNNYQHSANSISIPLKIFIYESSNINSYLLSTIPVNCWMSYAANNCLLLEIDLKNYFMMRQ